ncbi:fused MFS/spermidine synthase [Desulfospira joergensenii]|uniref:fused MFS/spermidine synthase n=1 Tax=Desulfospira joergensenii TaxID=53329 RepID=UPI00137852B8|nr:fused MFS/spermidine synthase [Desulfospira joergensenii]
MFKWFLVAAFFISGATSLSLEVAWSKELSYLLGVDIFSTTTVVTVYMLGLGLGALCAARIKWEAGLSIKVYGYLQLGIGFLGLISIPLFRSTTPLFTFLHTQLAYDSGWFLAARFFIVFLMMLLPVFLMGMTLPVVVGASYDKIKDRYAYLTGLLYGANTLGALFGTLAAGFYFVPLLGILKTCLYTGAADLMVGIAVCLFPKWKPALFLSPPVKSLKKKKKEPAVTESSRKDSFFTPNKIAWVFFFSGISALAYEIIWFRLLARIIGPSVHSFSIMLATYLAGIGLGSTFGSRLIRRFGDRKMLITVLLGFIGFGGLFSLFFINELPLWYGKMFIQYTSDVFTYRNLLVQAGLASLLILPVTIPLGIFFPTIVHFYRKEQLPQRSQQNTEVGHLYFFNTIGGVIGSLAAGFWMLPVLGIQTSLMLSAGLSIFLSLLWYLKNSDAGRTSKTGVAAGVILLFLIGCFAHPGADQAVLNSGVYIEMIQKESFKKDMDKGRLEQGRLLYFEEGINNSVAVVGNKFNDGNLTLHLSGGWVSSTEFHGRMHLEFLGHLPMLFAKKTETVGIIGFGTGVTAGNVLLYPDVKQVNIFELEQGVVNASRYFNHINDHPMKDPRANVMMIDGRSHITYSGIKYDIITTDPIHPFVAGAANLYTRDFYQTVSAHLNPGGVFCQWIPLSGISEDSYNVILNTVHDVFPHLALFTFFGESVVIGSATPFQTPWSTVEKRFYSKRVHEDFKKMDFLTPYNLAAFFLGAEKELNDYLSPFAKLSTDDNVWLEHQIPMDMMNPSRANLYFKLSKTFQKNNTTGFISLFPGISPEKLSKEMAGVARNGALDYQIAMKEKADNKFEQMETHLKSAISDRNNIHAYGAGIELVNFLAKSGRDREVLPVTAFLQRNFPTYPEAYQARIEALHALGEKKEAEDTLTQALLYLPDNPDLLKMKSIKE